MSWWVVSAVAGLPRSSAARKRYCANFPPANGSKKSCVS